MKAFYYIFCCVYKKLEMERVKTFFFRSSIKYLVRFYRFLALFPFLGLDVGDWSVFCILGLTFSPVLLRWAAVGAFGVSFVVGLAVASGGKLRRTSLLGEAGVGVGPVSDGSVSSYVVRAMCFGMGDGAVFPPS